MENGNPAAISMVAFDMFGTLVHGHQSPGPYLHLRDALGLDHARFRQFAMLGSLPIRDIVRSMKGDNLTGVDLERIAQAESAIEMDCANIRLFEDVFPALSQLRDAKIPYGIISNLTAPQVHAVKSLLQGLNLLPPEHLCIWSCHEGLEKPNAEIYARFCERANCAAANVLMVGDKERHDLLAPREAGLQSRRIVRDAERILKPGDENDIVKTLLEIPAMLGVERQMLKLQSEVTGRAIERGLNR